MNTTTKIACVLSTALMLARPGAAVASHESCIVTFAVTSNAIIGSLQLEVTYPDKDIKFDKTQGSIACTPLVDAMTAVAVGKGALAGTLTASLFNFNGFETASPLLECAVTADQPPRFSDFAVDVTAAAAPSTTPLSPVPTVIVSEVVCESGTVEPPTTTTTTTTTTTLPAPVEFCGDGIVAANEECDNGGVEYRAGDACREDCTLVACGDADASRQIGASDALIALRAAVGVSECDSCVCDVDSTGGPVTASDVLTLLSRVVDAHFLLTCPVCE